jgi:hypothetical protein
MTVEKIFCEYRTCEISITGCISRQKRAAGGSMRWVGTRRYYTEKNIPYDPACRDCEQGKKVMSMTEFPEFPEKVEMVKEVLPPKEPIKEDAEKSTGGIPYGYCHCGCGMKTNLVKFSDSKKGRVAGEPNKFIRGHAGAYRPEINQKPIPKKTTATLERQKPAIAMPADNVKLDFSLLSDGKELRSVLERIAEEELRTTDAQATWMIAQLIRTRI